MTRQCVRRYRRADDRWETLSARIETYASLLVDQGDLVSKKIGANRYWYLRFLLPADSEGHRRHSSLYVCREADEELLSRVRALLESYREHKNSINEIAGYVQIVRSLRWAAAKAAKSLTVQN